MRLLDALAREVLVTARAYQSEPFEWGLGPRLEWGRMTFKRTAATSLLAMTLVAIGLTGCGKDEPSAEEAAAAARSSAAESSATGSTGAGGPGTGNGTTGVTNPDGTPAPGGVPLNPDGTLAVTGIEFTVGEVAPGQPGSPSAPVPVAPVPAGSGALSCCSTADLSLSMSSDSSSNGKRKIELVFTNKSSDSCSVNGTPGVVLSGALSGSSQTLTYPVSNRVGSAKELALRAGGKANAVLFMPKQVLAGVPAD